jgi:hypothetical protein
MAIEPIKIARDIQDRVRGYLGTTFDISPRYGTLRRQFQEALADRHRLFRGPYLHGLAPYVRDATLRQLIDQGVLPPQMGELPLLDSPDRPLYWHQVEAIRRLRAGRNVVVASGTGSGKTLTFLIPILASILENPAPGIHALLLYPLNALVNDQLKNLQRVLRSTPEIRFGRYVNVETTPNTQKEAERLYPGSLPNEVISREVFRESPPHILITNYAMLEYLLLRHDDTPLFRGPWNFVTLDEAHTYTGAKGSEVALLLRRLRHRVKGREGRPPQYIGTSATLGTSDEGRRAKVARFASDLFHAPFAAEDIIEARKEHAPAEGMTVPDAALYEDRSLLEVCEAGRWTGTLSATLERAGFDRTRIAQAAGLAERSFEEALYQVFRDDARALRLREAAEEPRDLGTSARMVFGSDDETALRRLTALVRICSLARMPGGDARLVPCRYHFFVRGLNGAFIAFDAPPGGDATPSLFLDPTNVTPDGRTKTFELRVCRKCGQPYIFAYSFTEAEGRVLRAFGSPREGRGEPTWLTWDPPVPCSEDEADEADGPPTAAQPVVYHPPTGAYRPAQGGEPAPWLPLWLIQRGQEDLARCFACGGNATVTTIRAEAEAAQAVVTEAFYRNLPPSKSKQAHYYPGQGRKLLAFADSRQSAAYFAPYLENTHETRKTRWLIHHALQQAEGLSSHVSCRSLVDYMHRVAEDERLFPDDWDEHRRLKEFLTALVVEFCLPIGRRQSLEALGLVACRVDLKRWIDPPELLASYGLSADEQRELAQVLLATVRLQRAIELPPPLSANAVEFGFQRGEQAFVAQGSEPGFGKYRLHGFCPEKKSTTQRRTAFLGRVLRGAAARAGRPEPGEREILESLYAIWTSLVESPRPIFRSKQLAPGQAGWQLRWEDLGFSTRSPWFVCPKCNQWSPWSVLHVCPSFRCDGLLEPADPAGRLAENHYRRSYAHPDETPVPLTAREHTAQLAPMLATAYQKAFQDGHHPAEGQINVLSCSTTFELGVDLGDLEAVLLRNVPPSPANYQQRAGRAGRGIGSAAFVVTFSMPRSHDEHFFSSPEAMVDGRISPPRINLGNELIGRRHVQAVLLADFVHRWDEARGEDLRSIGQIVESAAASQPSPLDSFLEGLEEAIDRNAWSLAELIPPDLPATYLQDLAGRVREAFRGARDFFAQESQMYQEALDDSLARRNEYEQAKKYDKARGIASFISFLQQRIESLHRQDWVSFFSDRGVLPGYAFPIYNVTLATTNSELKLERDLRLALSEYAPGAAIVAKGRLWRSVGIRMPPRSGSLEKKHYAICPRCWHVERHLDKDEVFAEGVCPVCGHDGRKPLRRKHHYVVPSFGFTTDLQVQGEELAFDRPIRIPASRVLFVPQKDTDEPVRLSLGGRAGLWIEVRTSINADFFVFNDGEDPSGKGFSLCRFCGRLVEPSPKGKTDHLTPMGKPCQGTAAPVHLGHDFRGCAARLTFGGTGHPYDDQSFWMSLLYALLGGMSDALGIEPQDINGVIRPIRLADGDITQEIVLFDDVPGGAGHVQRLEDQEELLLTLEAALARVSQCGGCDASASCYRCLRSYRNQFCHDLLVREGAAAYLEKLRASVTEDPDSDRPYPFGDRANALATALRESCRAAMVVDGLTSGGPDEVGPWYILLQEVAARHKALTIAIRMDTASRLGSSASRLPLLAVQQAGATLLRVREDAPPPPYALLAAESDGRMVAFHWEDPARTAVLDAETHRRDLWYNRSARRLAEAEASMRDWLQRFTTEMPIRETLPEGYQIHGIAKGAKVNFADLFRTALQASIESVVLQDPYLATEHQLKCLEDLLRAIAESSARPAIPFEVRTHLSEPDLRDRLSIPTVSHLAELKGLFATYPCLAPNILLQRRRLHPIHMRFIIFRLEGGGRILYILERGLDIEDTKSGRSRNETYILEFPDVPAELAPLLRL